MTRPIRSKRFFRAESGPPTTGFHRQHDVIVDSDGDIWVCVETGTPGTWEQASGEALLGLPASLPGAVAAARFVGATTSGAPTTGTFAKGDYIVDQSGTMWVCTVAGSPGTWLDTSSGRQLAREEATVSQSGISTTFVDITGLSITFTVKTRPVDVEAWVPWVAHSAVSRAVLSIRTTADEDKALGAMQCSTAGGVTQVRAIERITTPGTYTRKAALARSGGSGTLTNNADLASVVSFIQATER